MEPTAEQLQSVVGLDSDDYTSAYVRYVETDFGADDVYIVLPKEGEDENGNSHRENIIAQLRERKDARVPGICQLRRLQFRFDSGERRHL